MRSRVSQWFAVLLGMSVASGYAVCYLNTERVCATEGQAMAWSVSGCSAQTVWLSAWNTGFVMTARTVTGVGKHRTWKNECPDTWGEYIDPCTGWSTFILWPFGHYEADGALCPP